MRILLVTPAPGRSLAGNGVTARRWAAILRALGHRVAVAGDYVDGRFDLLVALHAWRSASAIVRFRAEMPQVPIILALTGTDLYRSLESHPELTKASMAAADALVALHDLAWEAVPPEYRSKVRVIYQSARPIRRHVETRRHFTVCQLAHLREEKDPLLCAGAVRGRPADSRIRVVHLGKALTPEWAEAARAAMAATSRYRWLGERPHGEARRLLRRSRLLVLSSLMEGGANVISEALVAGVPVLASRIPGNVGLLGEDYPGYFPAGDGVALRELLLRAERDADFYRSLQWHCGERADRFLPEREAQAWAALLREMGF